MKQAIFILTIFFLFLPQAKANNSTAVGAVGDLAVNIADVSPELKPVVDAFNIGMGIIGVKNVGKGVVNFAKQIPENVKTLIQENKSIKSLLAAKCAEWQTAINNINKLNINDIDLIAEQEQIWRLLQITDKVDNYIHFIASARQRAILNFGKEAEDLIYVKFNANGGAAAEIIDHFGQEGINALKKVSNIQDAASELIKGKTAYRYLNESSFNINKIKSGGIIDASTTDWPTYITVDKYELSTIAKSKLQLLTEPTMVVEFDANQILSDVKFPYGKGQSANYLEVLAKSYTTGELQGGGSQFITYQQIKIKRVIDLKTNQIIIEF